MILGNLLISLALATSLIASYFYFLSTQRMRSAVRYARWAVLAMGAIVGVASVYLLFLILTDQFQYEVIWENSGASLPLLYKFSAFWGGQEGSIMLWLLWASVFAVVMSIIYTRRREADSFEPQVMFVMSSIPLFPLTMLLVRSPFRLLPDVPFDGRGLNPLLQDPYMAIHPPILFVGFAGLAIPFAFAVAALWKRDYSGWLPRAWPWTLFGWAFLGLGLAIGGFWAYRVLGWGGYWGWDPVENSSLVPWLLGGGLIHGMIVQKSRGRMVRTNLLLALSAYVLVLYSTFLTRSGVLADFSVHTFGESPLMPYMLTAIIVAAVTSIGFFILRYRDMPGGSDVFQSLLSRDFMFLVAIIVFIFMAAAVGIGTSSPLITGLIAGNGLLCGTSGVLLGLGALGERFCTQSNVATGYYNTISLPLGIVTAIIVTVAPILAWQTSPLGKLRQLLLWPFVAAVAGTIVAALLGWREPVSLFVLFFALFALGTNAEMIVRILRANWWKIGGYLAHVGLALALVGIIGTNAYKQVQTVKVFQGETVQALDHSFQFQGLEQKADGKWAMQVMVRKGDSAFLAQPRLLPTDNGMVRNPHVHKYFGEDLYISPGDYDPGSAAGTQIEVAKGQTASAEGYTFKFIDYQRAGHDTPGAQSNIITVGAILEVTKDGVTTVLTPTISSDPQKGLVTTAATIPGTQIDVTLDGPQIGAAIITVLNKDATAPATPPFITLEVSREPMVNSLWLGLVLIFAGATVAVVRRRIEGRWLLEQVAVEAPLEGAETDAAPAPRRRPWRDPRAAPQPSRLSTDS